MTIKRFCRLVAVLVLLSLSIGSLAAEERLTAAPEGSFSVVLIPDTQAYHGADTKAQPDSADRVTNRIFEAHVRWIADNIDRQNIALVSHVGDIVDKNDRSQWEVARTCMDVLHGKVPYGISVGNHDMTSKGNTPQQMWEKCYCKHQNLFAVFSGDQSRTQAIRAATPGDRGNVVHELLQDYGTGWLRLYRFLPADDSIRVFTFDPNTEVLCEGTDRVPDKEEHQFAIAYDMN